MAQTNPLPAVQVAETVDAGAGWRYTPHVIIFFSSACIMVVELVAGRLTGRHLRASLYTWTSISGVVLAGMSIGSWVGGRMADRWPHQRLLGWMFLTASVACVACLLLNKLLADTSAVRNLAGSLRVGYPGRAFISMLAIFCAPAVTLGAISGDREDGAGSRAGRRPDDRIGLCAGRGREHSGHVPDRLLAD